MYSRRSVHSSSPELSGFGIAAAVAQELGLIMLVWRSETQPRALLPLIFILAMTYHSTDTDITASHLSVCLLAGLLILNHGLVRTQLSVTSNQPGPSQRTLKLKCLRILKPKKEMAPILRGVCLIMHGKCLRAARGGGEAAEEPFSGWSRLQDSASVCFDTCQLGHPVAHLELLSEYHSSSQLKESPHHKAEVIMR